MNETNLKPPRLAEWILHFISKPEERFSVIGDFEEIYGEIAIEGGITKAQYWYWFQIIKSAPLFLVNYIYWSIAMFKSYFKITVRNLLKNKVFSFINISGLAVGMACCIIVFLFVQDELSYDRFHENADNIYRVIGEIKSSDTGGITRSIITRPVMAPNLIEEFPEVVNAVRIDYYGSSVNYGETQCDEYAILVDSSFLEFFTFPLIKGDKKTALKEPNSVIITENFAKKYFGNEDPIGKILTIKFGKNNEYRITGILKNIPKNSHRKYDVVATNPSDDYFWVSTYLLLRKGASTQELEDKLHDFTVKHLGEEHATKYKYFLQALTSIHLGPDYGSGVQLESDLSNINYSYAYSVIAFIILLIACVNFMNLSTARASRRAKEVGIRKVVGAKRAQLVRQFIGESLIIAFLALTIAIVLALFSLPHFNAYTGKQLTFDPGNNQLLYIGLLSITTIVGFIAGSYPALFTSSFKPVDVIKQNLSLGAKGTFVRKGLVIFQFAISLVFIIGTIIVFNQINFMRHKDLGFDKEYVLKIRSFSYATNRGTQYEIVKNELLTNPNITKVGISWNAPGIDSGQLGSFNLEGFPENESMNMSIFWIGYDFLDFYGIEIIEGRGFSYDNLSNLEKSLLLNETAVKQIGWDSPIGKRIKCESPPIDGTVIGVVKDFHTESLYEKISPIVFKYKTDLNLTISIKILPDNIPETLSFLEQKWNEHSLDPAFSYSFLDDYIAAFYREEERTSKVFIFASTLSIFLACLGLFGLASFSAERRVKEIGIRKTLGATVPGIVVLLSKDFAKLVLAANVIAWPIAYLIVDRWLQNFAYKVNIGWWMFLLAGILTLAIALITISYQSIKAATANPIDSLRYE